MAMGGFREELNGAVGLINSVLIVQVISMVISVIALYLIHDLIVHESLMALSMVLLVAALIDLLRVLSKVKELYLTRIRDAIWTHKAALDVNRESRELWVRARAYVMALLIMVIASLSLTPYLLIKSLGLAPPYYVITWVNLALLVTTSLTEVYVIARVECSIWI